MLFFIFYYVFPECLAGDFICLLIIYFETHCAHGELSIHFLGSDGDDFLALGIRSGRVLHKFNLGSGVATIVSDRLNLQINIHTVVFGRSRNTGWLKVICD